MKRPTQSAVAEFVTEEVADWDDDVKSISRFKAFSGQRSDWDPQFRFWRDLILKIAYRFRMVILSPSEVKSCWFSRGGLVPLCLDDVLLEMYKAGDLAQLTDFEYPASGRLTQLFKRVLRLAGSLTLSSAENERDDRLIVVSLLKDKAGDVVKALSESHWTSSCVITMEILEGLCGGKVEASTVMGYMSGCGKAKYLHLNRGEAIEGVKVSLSQAMVSDVSNLDYDKLQVVWTVEKLQKQQGVIDQRYEMSRKLALAALKEGNKNVALRHARALKLASRSREQVLGLLNRVEEVLHTIEDAESTKKVSEAIQVACRAMKEQSVDADHLKSCLQELDEHADMQKQLSDVLESTSYSGVEFDDIEDELNQLELELNENPILPKDPKSAEKEAISKPSLPPEIADSLSEAMSGLNLRQKSDAHQDKSHSVIPASPAKKHSKAELEPA